MEAQKLDKIYEGKAKDLFTTNIKDCLIQTFKDDATAFNKKKHQIISGKGTLNNLFSEFIMQKLADAGIANHFIKRLNERDQLIKQVKIIPLEVIVRNIASGSFSKNYGITKGTKLSTAVVEFSYKNDELCDPLIPPSHIVALGIASEENVIYIASEALKINKILSQIMDDASVILVDFKIEFGTDSSGKVILADEISPDSCRLWDKNDASKNFDKDIFRHETGDLVSGYKEIMNRLKINIS